MKRLLLFLGAVVGGLLAMAPLLVGVIGMLHAFSVLGSSHVSDPQALAGAIGKVLGWAIVSLGLLPLGAILAAWCINWLLRKPKLPPPLPRGPGSAISDPHA